MGHRPTYYNSSTFTSIPNMRCISAKVLSISWSSALRFLKLSASSSAGGKISSSSFGNLHKSKFQSVARSSTQMSALSKFHSTRLSIQELLSGRIRLQRYGLFLKLKYLYPNKMQINFILTTRVQRNR